MRHFAVLDGWRGISILLVLAGHMLPLGPKRFNMNVAVAASGMALFFTLSGFLITSTLLYQPSVPQFLIRRFCRILPLAWLFTLAALSAVHAPWADYPAQLLFYANVPPFWLTGITAHFWSLCVEMQFYMAVAAICLISGRRGLLALPFLCLAVTADRIVYGQPINIITWFRVDEILAGATLALLMHLPGCDELRRRILVPLDPYLLMVLLLGASHGRLPWLNYARPYIAACLVGCTLVRERGSLSLVLASRPLRYLAEISYALYVLHPATVQGWLGDGSTLVKYAKRPFCIALAFFGAHFSTKYYEHRWIRWGKKWSQWFALPLEPAETAGAVVTQFK